MLVQAVAHTMVDAETDEAVEAADMDVGHNAHEAKVSNNIVEQAHINDGNNEGEDRVI